MTNKAERTIQTPDGRKITISSEELSESALALAEVLLELSTEQGSLEVSVHEDELARRLRRKGFDPDTGERLH